MTDHRLEKWQKRLESGDVDLGELRDDLGELDAEVERGDTELQKRRAVLDALRQDRDALAGLRNFLAHTSGRAVVSGGGDVTVNGRRGTKRDAILAVLREAERPMPITELRDELVANGSIEGTLGAYKALQTTLSEMFREGLVGRPRQGLYELSPIGAIQK